VFYKKLARAILDCIEVGTCVLDVSAGLAQPSSKGERTLEEVQIMPRAA
jgi:hypothetical protein